MRNKERERGERDEINEKERGRGRRNDERGNTRKRGRGERDRKAVKTREIRENLSWKERREREGE